jgi:hypothetical protein
MLHNLIALFRATLAEPRVASPIAVVILSVSQSLKVFSGHIVVRHYVISRMVTGSIPDGVNFFIFPNPS